MRSAVESIKYVAKPAVQGRKKAPGSKKTGGPEKYNKAFVTVLLGPWEFFDFQCGKLLAPLVKGMIDFLVQEFNMSEDIRTLLLSVSPATIDRKLSALPQVKSNRSKAERFVCLTYHFLPNFV
jgi:hypothetical protein